MCCSSSTKLDVSPMDFYKSPYLADIKNTISKDKIPPECYQGCLRLEEQGYTSTRSLALNDWDYDIDTVPDEILYLDLRHSNLCNFSCRSCEPSFSSEIAKEIQDNRELSKYHTPTNIHLENHKSQQDIKLLLPTVKRLNFTGGEPLLIKENIAVLEELIRLDNTDCELLITTNASVINYKIVELIKHFDNVHWTISLDAVSHVAEYVRNGTIWSMLVNNIKQILSTRQSVGFNTVLSAYSVLDINNLLVFFKNLKIEYAHQPLEIWFSICKDPIFLNPVVLNDALKQTAIKQLQQAIDLLSTIEDNPKQSIQTLKSLQHNLNKCIMYASSYNTFVNYTLELDQIRNQNFEETFGVKL